MNCSSCNKRIPASASKCPDCGRSARRQSLAATNPPLTLDDELELDEEASPDPSQSSSQSQSQPQSRRVKKARASRPASTATPVPPASPAPRPAASGAGVPDVRTLVVEKPELVEEGLSVYQKAGVTGAGFATPVGEIDLLAIDSAGGLVMLMVFEADAAKDLVSEFLPRLGWVRKHMAKAGQEVRGIALLDSFPEEAQYAAAAVADTVTFKTYRLALTFDEVSL